MTYTDIIDIKKMKKFKTGCKLLFYYRLSPCYILFLGYCLNVMGRFACPDYSDYTGEDISPGC
jgi:hypothetical protein